MQSAGAVPLSSDNLLTDVREKVFFCLNVYER